MSWPIYWHILMQIPHQTAGMLPELLRPPPPSPAAPEPLHPPPLLTCCLSSCTHTPLTYCLALRLSSCTPQPTHLLLKPLHPSPQPPAAWRCV